MANSNLQLSINFDQEVCLSEMRIPSLDSSNSNSKAYASLEEREDIACHFFDDFDEELKPSNQGSMLEVRSYRFGDSGMDLEHEAQGEQLAPGEESPLDVPGPQLEYFVLNCDENNSESPEPGSKCLKKVNSSKKESKNLKKRKLITQKIQEIFKHKTQRRKKASQQVVKS